MKKLLISMAGVVLIGVIGAASWYYVSPDQVARRAIQRYGSEVLEAEVRVNSVRISPADGTGDIRGMSVGNPAGFRTPTAISADTIRISLEPDTMGLDAFTIRTLAVVSPRITYELGEKGSNLAALLENIQHHVDRPGRKFFVDRMVIRDASLTYPSPSDPDRTITVPLRDIRISNLGRTAGGITSAELARTITENLIYQARRALPADALPAASAGRAGT